MEELKRDFPHGVDYQIVYDPTVFVRGLHSRGRTHAARGDLAGRDRSDPVSADLARLDHPLDRSPGVPDRHVRGHEAFGFSLNALSLFGLVLAIGIVVDDAIVVVENVERNIAAACCPSGCHAQAMREVTGPIVATALVLCAVFVPTAFISGLTGQFYKQFALTIAISTVISAFNSLTLSPALSALLLRAHGAPPDRLTVLLNGAFGWLFRPFNRLFARASRGYVRGVGRVVRAGSIVLLIYGGLIALTYVGFDRTPTGFVPQQDKQYLVAFAQLPPAATLDRTEEVIRRMGEVALRQPGVESAVAFPGLNINGLTNSPSSGIVFVTLKPFEQRRAAMRQPRRDRRHAQSAPTARFRTRSSPSSRPRR